jgi:hypothetical protein
MIIKLLQRESHLSLAHMKTIFPPFFSAVYLKISNVTKNGFFHEIPCALSAQLGEAWEHY